MRKRERSTQLLFVCLVSLFLTLPASAQEFSFSISPTTLNLNDVENFISLQNFAAGTDSTVVRYTLGDASVDIAATQVGDPQLGPVSYQAWVPVIVLVCMQILTPDGASLLSVDELRYRRAWWRLRWLLLGSVLIGVTEPSPVR